MYIDQLGQGIKTILLTIFMSLSLSIYAHNHNQTTTYFSHLSEINKEWLNHKEVSPKGNISFNSDADRIQLHLNLVVKYLTSNRASNLNSTQLANRASMLAELQKYIDKKVFPVNKYHSARQPYFVDDIGTNCAVGQMIYISGYEHLVSKISEEHNYDYIQDIKTEGLTEWANEFGFTIDELKWIQPGYPPSAKIEQVLGGTNGSVNKLEYNFYNGSLTIAGEFTELNNLPCLNVGFYHNNQLACLGTGVDGIIYDVIHESGAVYVFGDLNHNGETYPGAKYDGSTWSYIEIPNRDGAMCTSAHSAGIGHLLEMAINHDSIPGHQEIWHFLNDSTWEKKAKVKGTILDILASSYGRVHVGHLDTVMVYNSNSIVDTTLTVNNVLINTNYSNIWYGIGSSVSDTVNAVAYIGGALIFGGTCSYQPGSNNICLSRYFNSTLQPLFLNNYGTENFSIKAISYYSGNELTFGGDVNFMQPMGTFGSKIATYNLVHNYIKPIALLDKPVNSLAHLDGDLYIGGSFQTNLGVQNINFLAREVTSVGTNEFSANENFQVYPNPFTSSLHLIGIENGISYSLLSINGQTLKKGIVMNEEITDLDFLTNGVYLLRIESSNGHIVRRIFK
ncbi:hypothetical protein Oweho_0839 [Owenweeksia hongkongensis DSM 17368]|uniref:Uncharacterized protein n=1 Tax=Owenweeksia hongkongensis (strain DSM 17368 / CIP 108786 / JCM 12287 / NRRL B-23963 / UST20020801) TaxID=926562 RepID=G8R2P7_OWEHD|nr:T9SS type A sorting domain-containing protein [Owenweeksia hongkongensis]AEV31852.1 hypothetical protein Oweho_0839 [Owenweeksia hongkongensis DSM 17368]